MEGGSAVGVSGGVRVDAARGFRLRGSAFFLTWPRCDATCSSVLTYLQTSLGEFFRGAVVARESHADGTPHLHAYVECKKRFSTSSSRFFDFDGVHGNYQVARQPRQCHDYVTKAGSFESVGELRIGGDSGGGVKRRVAEEVADFIDVEQVPSLNDIMDFNKGFYLMNRQRIIQFRFDVLARRSRPLLKWDPARLVDVPVEFASPSVRAVHQWLLINMFIPRLHRQKQLYLMGPTGVGKTCLMNMLLEVSRVYLPTIGCQYWDFYDDESVDMIFFDEFCGSHMHLTLLNKVLEGSEVSLKRRYNGLRKKKNVPVILASNILVFDQYQSASFLQREAFMDRVDVVNVVREDRLDLYAAWVSAVLQ